MCIHSKEVAIDKDEAIQFIWQFPIVVLEGLIFIVRVYRRFVVHMLHNRKLPSKKEEKEEDCSVNIYIDHGKHIYKMEIAIQSIARWVAIQTVFDFITAGLVCIIARTREISKGENIKWYLLFLGGSINFFPYGIRSNNL